MMQEEMQRGGLSILQLTLRRIKSERHGTQPVSIGTQGWRTLSLPLSVSV